MKSRRVIIRNLTKHFGNVQAVRGVSLEFNDGEFSVLLGPSGCGKSTILRCIAGLERITSGEVICGDTLFASDTIYVPPERRRVGMVFQSYAIWPHLTVFDNIAYPLKLRRVPRAKIREAVARTAEMLGIEHFLDRNATMLSGGEQQRVALARSLVYEPEVLLLDEPLSNLDAKIRREVRAELRQIQQNVGVTVIYVTHDQEEAMVLGDQVIVLRDGQVQQTGPPVFLYSEPINRWVASFLGSANVLEIKSVHRVGDKIEVETIGGLKAQAESPQWDPTEARYLCIRREHILVSEEASPTADSETDWLAAEIEGLEFVGDRCEVEVKVAEEKLWIYSSERFMVGHKVSINLPSRSVRLLKE